jgi:hypothetical protein
MVRPTALRALAVALLLAACDSSTDAEPLTGVYVAQSANGRPIPAVLDSIQLGDGQSYLHYRLMGASVQFLDGENARYTVSMSSGAAEHCTSFPVPYRRQYGRVILVVAPVISGDTGPLRLDSLQVRDDRLVQTIRTATGKTATVEYARAQRPETC